MADKSLEIAVKLKDQFSGPLGKLDKSVRDFGAGISDAFKGNLRSSLPQELDFLGETIDKLPLGAGIAAGAIAGLGAAAVKMALDVKDSAVAFDQLGQKTGASVEFLSGFTAAANDAEISTETVNQSLIKFADNLVKTGGAGANTEAELLAHADTFANMADGPAKTALAIDAFGRSGAAMIPILNEGSAGLKQLMADMQATGRVMTTETVEAAMRLDDQLDRLNGRVDGLKLTVGSGLVPVLADLAGGLDAMLTSFPLVSSGLNQISETGAISSQTMARMQQVSNDLLQGMSTLNPAIGLLVDAMGGIPPAANAAATAEVSVGRAARIAAMETRAAGDAFWDAAGKFHSGAAIIEGARARAMSDRNAVANAKAWTDLTTKYGAAAAKTAASVYKSSQANRGATDSIYAGALATERGATAAALANAQLDRQVSLLTSVSSAGGGASATLDELNARLQSFADRSKAIGGAIGGSLDPMTDVQRLQEAYALATGETTVEQLANQEAVKAATKALQDKRLTDEQALSALLMLRDGTAQAADIFKLAGDSGKPFEEQLNRIIGTANESTTKVSSLNSAITKLPGEKKVNVSAIVLGRDDVSEMQRQLDALKDKTVTVSIIGAGTLGQFAPEPGSVNQTTPGTPVNVAPTPPASGSGKKGEVVIETPVNINGREIARQTARYYQ